MEFKIGDKVRLIRNSRNDTYHELVKGDIGFIKEFRDCDIVSIENEYGKWTRININGIELIKNKTMKELLED